jgi:plasmid stabilization system protein ParE
MSELSIAEAAEEEYADSFRWYAQRSMKAAERFESEFAEALEAIAANPERYPVCDDGRHRFYLFKRYPFLPNSPPERLPCSSTRVIVHVPNS